MEVRVGCLSLGYYPNKASDLAWGPTGSLSTSESVSLGSGVLELNWL